MYLSETLTEKYKKIKKKELKTKPDEHGGSGPNRRSWKRS